MMKAYQMVPTLNGKARSHELCVRIGDKVYDVTGGDFAKVDGEIVFLLDTVPQFMFSDDEPDSRPPVRARSTFQRRFDEWCSQA